MWHEIQINKIKKAQSKQSKANQTSFYAQLELSLKATSYKAHVQFPHENSQHQTKSEGSVADNWL